ncbi:hypothetical protein VTO58DRAFT_110448 [Aureobasidium pullulans]
MRPITSYLKPAATRLQPARPSWKCIRPIVVRKADSEISHHQASAKSEPWSGSTSVSKRRRNPAWSNDAGVDYALALQLQEEEKDNQRRAQAAQHQQEDEPSRQFLERESASTSEQRLASTPELRLTSTSESRLAVHAVRKFDEEEVQPPRDTGWNVDGEEDSLAHLLSIQPSQSRNGEAGDLSNVFIRIAAQAMGGLDNALWIVQTSIPAQCASRRSVTL